LLSAIVKKLSTNNRLSSVGDVVVKWLKRYLIGGFLFQPPPEEIRNDNMIYYWDLLAVINMTRVINHLVSVLPQCQATVTITHFLQPTMITTHSILLLLFNLMVFNEDRLRDIAPHEEVLFSKTDQVLNIINTK
jgi:hypothetical protein